MMKDTNLHPIDALKDAQAIVNTLQFLCAEIPQGAHITLRSDYLSETLYRVCQLLDMVETNMER